MIYKTLRKLPIITYVEIMETGDVSLLSDEETPIEELIDIWENLRELYKEKYNSKDAKKVFSISKEVEYLENKYNSIKLSVEALKFNSNEDLINIIKEYGYTLTSENYLDDLVRVERECEGIIHKINNLKANLPKQIDSDNDNDGSITLINLMAGYSTILGYDFDYYTVSVEKFYSLERQVKQKIASIKKNIAKK